MAKYRSLFHGMRTLPERGGIARTEAGVRRAWRKRKRKLIRQGHQLRAAQDIARGIMHDGRKAREYGEQLRDINVGLAEQAHQLVNDARIKREKFTRAEVARLKRRESAVLALIVLGIVSVLANLAQAVL